MTEGQRYRFPDQHRDTTRLVVLLAGLAGVIAVLAVVAAVTLWFRLNAQVDRVNDLSQANAVLATQTRRAQQATFTSRRAASLEGCQQREQLKRDMRAVLARFRVDTATLPSSTDGRPVLSPLIGGCAAYVRRTVPEASRP